MSLWQTTICPLATGKERYLCRQLYKYTVSPEKFVKLCLHSSSCHLTSFFYFRFDNADMLEYIPNETEVLIFTGNNIGFLRNNIIGNYEDHLTLRVIDLSNNNLSEISGKAFHKVSEVRILILNHNNLRISGEESHPRVLTNFQQLEQLHLTNAFTEMIDSKYYLDDLQTWLIVAKAEGLESLSTLYLDQNEIW